MESAGDEPGDIWFLLYITKTPVHDQYLGTSQSVMCLFYNHLFNESSDHYNVVL